MTAAPTPDPALDLSAEIDIIFDTFMDTKLGKYLAIISEAASIPVSRISVTMYTGTMAMEFGMQYIFPIRILPPVNGSHAKSEFVAAKEIEDFINSAALNGDNGGTNGSAADAVEVTMVKARRVIPAFRQRETSAGGVNLVWVAFLIAGAAMLLLSGGLLWRQRGGEIESEDADNLRIPKDDYNENTIKMRNMLENAANVEFRKEDELERTEEVTAGRLKLAKDPNAPWRRTFEPPAKPSTDLFEAAILYDRRFQLPPIHRLTAQGGIPNRSFAQPNTQNNALDAPLLVPPFEAASPPQVPQIVLNDNEDHLL
jgi:hypothetical protein